MKQTTATSRFSLLASETEFDSIDDRLRAAVRASIAAAFEAEPADFPGRLRYSRGEGPVKGYGRRHRER